jgi:undecaprenyl-diphosphatase
VLVAFTLVSVPAGIGYPVLFLLVAAETVGALVPGETALIVAGALAARGGLSLPVVIAVAASAAILGDNLGYLIGRNGLSRILRRVGGSTRRQRALERGEAFFNRHGRATVFFGRWLPGLRIVAAWLAGANHMPWRRFLLWNGLGGVAWASTVGGAASLLGRTASSSLSLLGFVGIGVAVLVYGVQRLRGRAATPSRT